LALTILVIASGYMLNLWIVPASLASFRQFQWEIRNQMAAFLLQEGVFTPISDDLTVYVRSRDTDGTLRGILVDDQRNKAAYATILAEHGRLVEGPNGPRVLLVSGSRQEIDHQTGRLNVLTFAQNELDLTDSARNDGERLRDMTELSLDELLDPHPPNLRDIPKWIAEGHKRLASPLTAFSFAMVALLSVLSGAFRRHGSILRPLAAVGTVVVLLATGLAVENLAARDNTLLPLVWLQAVTPGVICGWILLGPRLRMPLRQAAEAT
jgi:lipopolysaccharide export system permease protein